MTRFKQLLARPHGTGRFQLIKDSLAAHIEGSQQQDDISLVAIRCGELPHWLPRAGASAPQHSAGAGQSRWRLNLSLGAEELKRLDALPLIMNWLDQLQIGAHHRGQAFLVLGELFNNALDHGVLQLDSRFKQDPNGFEQYINMRERRLATLADCSVEVDLERFQLDDQDRLRITVRDSGPGFDFAGMIANREAAPDQFSGRGILLVKQMCLSLDYSGKGNEATAVYHLS
jgi:hypothetical protein